MDNGYSFFCIVANHIVSSTGEGHVCGDMYDWFQT